LHVNDLKISYVKKYMVEGVIKEKALYSTLQATQMFSKLLSDTQKMGDKKG